MFAGFQPAPIEPWPATAADPCNNVPIVVFLITWFSWRFSFVALGAVSAFWAALWWWTFHEDPRQHPAITSAELAALPADDPAALVDPARPPDRGCSAHRQFGCGGRIEPTSQIEAIDAIAM